MKKSRFLVMVAIAFGILFAGATTAFADDYCPVSYYEHSWETVDSTYHRCRYCGATETHNMLFDYFSSATCEEPATNYYECKDCHHTESEELYYAPHNWEYSWWDFDNTDDYVYAKCCNTCDESRIVKKTVKRKKYKRILPKSFFKGAKKVHLSYNKKKVMVTKNGKVKGKKRGATAKIVWDIKYKNHRGYIWWESYTVYVKVK